MIGKKGEDVDRLRREITTMMGVPVHINIEEVRKPELDARLVAQNIAGQLERLEGLRDRGTITDDEFDAQKRRLLDG